MALESETAAKVRLADPPPPRCSSCYGQYPDRKHVDFGADYDGAVFETPGENRSVYTVDDLILCDGCMANGVRALGWALEDPERTRALEARVQNLSDQLDGALRHIKLADEEHRSREQLARQLNGETS
jgi:hypothetical protein